MSETPKSFEPAAIEAKWGPLWERSGVYEPTLDPSRPSFSTQLPPPNVTGTLHMGHAFNHTVLDVLTRWHRMRGFNTLWQPGIDHAGIATQTVVERQLKREGKSRHDLGREAFIERVWQWKSESGGRIALQQRELGASPDWPRSKFTMDADMSRAVREAFVRLFEQELIYRDTRLVHWDCEAQTVLSNLEVENEEANGELFEFAYPVAGAEGELVVATTRPETMLGDTAVAVHPDDPRYKHLHGKFLQHPFVDRLVPIITDAILVDPKFGTGAVKVTPAHDFNDHETGKRHKLPMISIMNKDGTLNAEAGPFVGMERFAARKAVKKALEEKGLVRGSKNHQLVLPRSERNGSIVEPMISTQWFVKMKPLAGPALAAVRHGHTKIIPEDWTKTYEHWMTNILDWCISRQLWWGHRIPAFYCDGCNHVMVTREDPTACEKCGGDKLRQDEDVLDTWFSSGLWPFSTLGWPNDTDMLRKFYPASDLETGYDILFFWVARMMMMGIHFMGAPPFKRILLHGMVVDETGDKMSKVKGNVIDPLDLVHGSTFESVVEKTLPGAPRDESLKKFKKAYPSASQMGAGFSAYGADALRFTLSTYAPQARRIPLSPKKIEGNRHFCNKIWNAVRYALPYLEGARVGREPPKATTLTNRWILSRLGAALETTKSGLDEFRLDEAALALYHFFWGELCDWYLELTKPVLNPSAGALPGPEQDETKDVLAYVIEASIRALHPFIPYITEELWQRLPRPEGSPKSVALATYPAPGSVPRDADAERDMGVVMAAISAARTIRSEHEVHPGAEVPLLLRADGETTLALLRSEARAIKTLVKTAAEPGIEARGAARPKGYVMSMASGVEVLVDLRGLVEGAKEAARIEREIKKTEKDIAALEKKLSLPSFADKAPPEVVAESRSQLDELKKKRAGLEDAKGLAAELEEKK